jgi:hypothetical protein
VIPFVPTSSGTRADQLAVPAAVPEIPVEVFHWTAVTATVSAAVPLTTRNAAEVARMVEPGERIRSVGGVRSGFGGGWSGGWGGGAGLGCG